ncbi:unnamed protein product [Allacma fusca]|uniref:Uncharacterized protein n=1 Tax=Allacma fusca TaxID=39272 RepID=A0A8J2P0Y1_9HEXA|nr:unnamed protein product [Allacma fusca]
MANTFAVDDTTANGGPIRSNSFFQELVDISAHLVKNAVNPVCRQAPQPQAAAVLDVSPTRHQWQLAMIMDQLGPQQVVDQIDSPTLKVVRHIQKPQICIINSHNHLATECQVLMDRVIKIQNRKARQHEIQEQAEKSEETV